MKIKRKFVKFELAKSNLKTAYINNDSMEIDLKITN